jgi:hypothetical protein
VLDSWRVFLGGGKVKLLILLKMAWALSQDCGSDFNADNDQYWVEFKLGE